MVDSESFSLIITGLNRDLKSGIELYPNPVGDELKVLLLKGTFSQSNAELVIFDQSARKVFSRSVNDQEISLRTDALNPGIYMLTVAGRNRVAYRSSRNN